MTNSENKKVVIIGVGNILLKDEGIGIHAVGHLKRLYDFPSNVEIVDGGVGGLNLLPYMERAENLIIIDAVQANAEPGAIFRFTPKDISTRVKYKTSLHEMGLQEVFVIAEATGKRRPKTVIIGIQPKDISSLGMELTAEVEAKLPDILNMVVSELKNIGIRIKKPA
ncbi:MAG: HyaD/HybD family hydrogenase maturation endopeptidase [Deltaproteobacteria bacterium]|nr:HyaD/HybD family hydrogenase maturation endopeptidase [Deltaproteobacteria bacterium]